ncbi:DUF4268 domain-containing protein [Nocardioides dilutus]
MVKAQETYLETLLEGKKQYQVPLYQRVYAWDKKDRDRLWDDILELVETRRTDNAATHFIGSVVLAESPDNAAARMQRYLVVDGQQRLTTLSLLIAALRDHLVATGEAGARQSYDAQYLINVYERDAPSKLLPTQADRTSFLAVIGGTPHAGSEDAIGDAYRYFLSRIAEYDDPDDPNDLVELEDAVLRGLAVVAVTAEASDNAYRIFESLNYTGKPLTQADLLKNYLFMRLHDRAEPIYNTVWLPLEKKLSSKDLELLFWLDLVKDDERAKQTEIYAGQQRRLAALGVDEVETEVRRIATLGDVLAVVLDPAQEPDPEVRHRLMRLRAWGSTTSMPLVIQILDRRARGLITTAQVLNVLTYLESYFVRRILIGRATANLNRTLLQAVRAVADESEVDVALRRFLSTGRKHFATDAQVRQAIQTVPFYWQGRGLQKKLILQWLEEALGSKEVVDPSSLTIEHVLPQTLSDEVREQFAAGLAEGADVTYEHERLVHTLGNLTLTGYNSELSNHPFTDKRAKLATSGLLMNQEIAGHGSWGAAEIAERSSLLAERVIALWPGPDESVVNDAASEETSALRATVAEVLGAIPAGRWTSYGEVAIVAGTYPQPLAAVLVRYDLPNAWRVLQAAGTVSPGFRWSDPTRNDDPRDVLTAEGVRFDEAGRAAPEDFLTAQDLAAAAGLDIDDETAPWREGGTGGAGIGLDQEAFYTELRALGEATAEHIDSWRRASRQHWYDIGIGSSRAHLSLTVNSVKKRVGVELYIPDDEALFHSLYSERGDIEGELGLRLDWQELPGKKACRAIASIPGDFRDPTSRPDLQRWMVETADSLAKVFRALL